jgi:replicative DNA helicase
MSYLTVRAEQALIGAMLADQPLPGELTYLRPDDFGHRVLRQIYTAILDLRDRTPLVQLPDAVASRIDTPGVDADWLRQLRDACPSVAHIAAYARMVQVSAFRREMAVQGERIATTAAVADHPADTGTAMTRMAEALTRQVEVYVAFTALDDNQALQLRRAPAAQQDSGPSERARREDEVLADLLAHPEQARELARIVDPGTFTSGQRREVYQTMVMLAEAGDPIDEIILLWEIERQRATADLYGTAVHTEDHHEPMPAYVARLATTVTTGTAITIGYALVLDDTRAKLDSAVAAAQGRKSLDVGSEPASSPIRAAQIDPNVTPPPSPAPGPQPSIEP